MSATAVKPRWTRHEIGRAVAAWCVTVRDEGLVGAMRLPSPEVLGGIAALAPLLVIAVYATGIEFDSRALVSRLILAYAVFIASFLGALWALLIDEPSLPAGGHLLSPERMAVAERGRLLLGIVPALVGGVALLSSFSLGMLLLLLDLLGLVAFEAWGARARGIGGRMKPARYMRLRWSVALIAAAILLDVMVYHLYGARIVF